MLNRDEFEHWRFVSRQRPAPRFYTIFVNKLLGQACAGVWSYGVWRCLRMPRAARFRAGGGELAGLRGVSVPQV